MVFFTPLVQQKFSPPKKRINHTFNGTLWLHWLDSSNTNILYRLNFESVSISVIYSFCYSQQVVTYRT